MNCREKQKKKSVTDIPTAERELLCTVELTSS